MIAPQMTEDNGGDGSLLHARSSVEYNRVWCDEVRGCGRARGYCVANNGGWTAGCVCGSGEEWRASTAPLNVLNLEDRQDELIQSGFGAVEVPI